MATITYQVNPDVSDAVLNELLANAWTDHVDRSFRTILDHSLTYICAYDGAQLVGFVNVAWDGGSHAFLLDTTVHSNYQRRGI